MSSSDALRRAAALSLALLAGGCLQPLYGEAAHPGLRETMQAIEIAPINAPTATTPSRPDAVGIDPNIARSDRLGHYLRNDLIFNFNGTGSAPLAKYRLVVTTSESTTTPTVESQISAASAATLTVTANYKLVSLDSTKLITGGTAASSAVYDLSLQRYANLRAGRDAEIRLAQSIADEIELRLAASLGQKPPP